MGWGGLFDKIAGWFTPGQKEKRWRIKLKQLESERKKILNQPASYKTSKKLTTLTVKISEIRRYLES